MRKVLVLGILALAGVFALAQEPIKIGCLLEFTGPCAAYGKMARDAIEFARAVGLVPTEVLGRPIELVYYDARTEPVEAALGATRLIEVEKVVAILGTMCSGPFLGAAEIVQKAGVPMLGITTTSPLTTRVGEYCFRACFVDDDQGVVAAYLAYEYMGARTAVIVVDVVQPYCVGLAKFFEAAFTALGGKVLATLAVRSGDVDYTAQLTEIARLNPDVIYCPNYYTEAALMIRQARDLGLTQPVLGGDGYDAPELLAIGGPAVEGTVFTTFFHEDAVATEIGLRFYAEYRKAFGRTPSSMEAMAVDAYLLMVDAIQRAGVADPKAIRDALAVADLEVVTGRTIMDPNTRNPAKDFVFLEVRGGTFALKMVLPAAEAKALKARIGL
jgi:branched-chain amino acid transport system substrate-binding protein